MLALSLCFPAGRFHATPWDRHVNEGAVAWPPEPWRILRALIATWHHKVKHTRVHDEATLLDLIESMTTELPEYRLPTASHSHTRHYMPQFASGKTSLIFDAFAAINRDEPLVVIWPHLDLPARQGDLLDDLLASMSYLGRAESWVETQRINDPPAVNCAPDSTAVDIETGELKGEIVTLYAPLPPDEYQSLRQRFVTDKKSAKKFAKSLPENLLDALSVETSELRKQGWSQPPAARQVSYLRPVDAFRPRYAEHRTQLPAATTANFIIVGKPLPRVEDTLRIGELMRMAVMSRAKHICGEDSIPAIFSGHGMPHGNRHGHAFYLPWDSHHDGHIDRLLVHVPVGMQAQAQRVVESVNRLWRRDGGEWQLVLESIGGAHSNNALVQPGRVWVSVTPYLHPWHCKKGFSVEDQIRRECIERGLPEPIKLTRRETINVGKNRSRRPIHFKRFRTRRGVHQPDRIGSFWQLEFSKDVAGPLALGFACHYGLGMFRPVGSNEDQC